MRRRVRWIIFEAMKIALVLALFSSLQQEDLDGRYQAVASTGKLYEQQLLHEDRLFGLEQEWQTSGLELARTTDAVHRIETGLAAQSESARAGKETVNELIDVRTSELQRLLRSGIERLEGTSQHQARAVAARVERLEMRIEREPLRMKQKMVYPVVQLRGNGTVGSGVVIHSAREEADGPAVTYLLTAYHVVQEITEGSEDPTRVEEVRFLDPETDDIATDERSAIVVTFKEGADIALLRMELDEPWPYVAHFASDGTARKIQIFDPVYAVGCPLGNKPLPTAGEVSSRKKRVAGQDFWMINAPTFFGNSGGGVFLHESKELIGISSMIYTYGKRQPMVVPHMGLFVPLETVRDWLRAEGFAQLGEGDTTTLSELGAGLRRASGKPAETPTGGTDLAH